MAPDWNQVWGTHKQTIQGVLAVAVAFRVLTAICERVLAKAYKGEKDVAIAVYRVVGLFHHVVQVPLAALVLSNKSMWADRLFSTTPLSHTMLIISSGYFAHDFIHCIENIKVQGISYVIHGAGCAAVYLFGLLQTPSMLHFYGAGFLMWEISSFPVHFRWFLFKMDAKPSLQLLNGLALLATFFFARIVWGFYLSYMYWVDILAYKDVSQAFLYTTLLANCALNLLNSYWFSLIAIKAVEAAMGKKDQLGKRD